MTATSVPPGIWLGLQLFVLLQLPPAVFVQTMLAAEENCVVARNAKATSKFLLWIFILPSYKSKNFSQRAWIVNVAVLPVVGAWPCPFVCLDGRPAIFQAEFTFLLLARRLRSGESADRRKLFRFVSDGGALTRRATPMPPRPMTAQFSNSP
jgi:hypothetical protein